MQQMYAHLPKYTCTSKYFQMKFKTHILNKFSLDFEDNLSTKQLSSYV